MAMFKSFLRDEKGDPLADVEVLVWAGGDEKKGRRIKTGQDGALELPADIADGTKVHLKPFPKAPDWPGGRYPAPGWSS